MNKPLAVLSKSPVAEIHVGFGEYRGHRFLDIRQHYIDGDDNQPKPTKKGVTVKPEQIGELISALEQAQVEAKARGMIP